MHRKEILEIQKELEKILNGKMPSSTLESRMVKWAKFAHGKCIYKEDSLCSLHKNACEVSTCGGGKRDRRKWQNNLAKVL